MFRLHVFVGIRWENSIGNFSGLRLSSRIIHGCMNSIFVDSIVPAETATEVETTSAISIEVYSHSQNLQNELVWPEKSFGGDHWDLEAGHDMGTARDIAVWRLLSYEFCVGRFLRCFCQFVLAFRSLELSLVATDLA